MAKTPWKKVVRDQLDPQRLWLVLGSIRDKLLGFIFAFVAQSSLTKQHVGI